MNEDVMKIFAKAKIVNGKIENVNPIEFGWAIEKMLKEYKELKEKISKYENQLDLDYVEENYIPKSKVKEKIEWIEKNVLENDYASKDDKDVAENQIYILEWLI